MEIIRELGETLEKKINDSDEVYITPHDDSDFDTISSAIGMSEVCNKFKKENYIIVNDTPQKLQSGVKKIIDETQHKYKYINVEEFNRIKDRTSRKLLITVDVNKKCLVSINKELEYFKNIIIIDHHISDEDTILTPDIFIDTLVSSTSEMIYNLMKYYNLKIDSYTAAYLLSGIMVDTDTYKRNTSYETLKIVKKLAKIMYRNLLCDYTTSLIKNDPESDRRVQHLVEGTIFQTINIDTVIATVLDRENPKRIYIKKDKDFAKTVDYLMRTYPIRAAFALGYTDKDTISISARSNSGLDVYKVMKQFGGGGHSLRAATEIKCDGEENILDIEGRLQKILKSESNDFVLTKK